MLDNETKRRIDTARDILVGKVPDPKSQVEQITIALIYKFMDDMDAESEELGGKRKFFSGDFERYGWKKLMAPSLGGFEVLTLYAEAIQKMNINPNIPQLFRNIFKNAYLPYRDPETLKSFLKIIDDFEYDHSERLGDAFEYLLSVLGSQGDAGQFRTPRHIIDFMVEIIAPKKNETILDPACGTAGFLISSYKHIIKHNSSNFIPEAEKESFELVAPSVAELTSSSIAKYKGDKLTPDERKKLSQNIKGYDISPDMVRLSLVNLYLHGFNDPKIFEYDTLTSEDNWNEYADVILANPPFMSPKGGIKPHKRFSIPSNRSEVLFVDYMVEHLTPNGKSAIIVPEGIIFQSGTAYKQLRKMLVENYLFAVVSLPAGVFNPYSDVKTSILLIDKALNKKTNKFLFAKIENDGFDLGAQRRPNKKSELPYVVNAIKNYVNSVISGTDFNLEGYHNLVLATKEKIAEKEDWNLSGERYRSNLLKYSSIFPYIQLVDVTEIITKGTTPTTIGYNFEDTGVNFVKIESITEDGRFIPTKFAHISQECHAKLERSQLKNEDVLFSIAGAFGRAAIVKEGILPANTNQALAIIRLKKELVYPNFLFCILKSNAIFTEIQKLKVGVAQYNLSLKQIGELKVPLPPLNIQKEIVAEIEGYQKIIDGARQVVENYKPHIIIEPSWPIVELGNIYDITYGLSESIADNIDLDGIKIISTAETNIDGSLNLSKIRKIKYFKKYDKFILKPDTLLFNWRNAPKHVGKTVYFNETNDKYIYASFLLSLIKKNDQINNLFYWAILNKMREDGYFKRMSRQAVNQTNFNATELSKILVPLPSLEVQNKIVEAFLNEQKLVKSNKELITIFEQKIKAKIASVWGE